MSKCIKCGSYAFNLYKEGIDQGGLCDVHYWQGRAHRAEALAEQPAQQQYPAWRTAGGIPRFKPAQQEPVAAQSVMTVRIWRDKNSDQNAEFKNWHKLPDGEHILYTSPPAQRKPLTDEQIKAMIPSADGSAEANKRRVEVLPGVMGTEFDEVDAWSMPLVLQIARAIEAAHGIKENT